MIRTKPLIVIVLAALAAWVYVRPEEPPRPVSVAAKELQSHLAFYGVFSPLETTKLESGVAVVSTQKERVQQRIVRDMNNNGNGVTH